MFVSTGSEAELRRESESEGSKPKESKSKVDTRTIQDLLLPWQLWGPKLQRTALCGGTFQRDQRQRLRDYIKVNKPEGVSHDKQLPEKYMFKEEPNFSDLRQLFAGDEGSPSIITFAKFIEDPTVLNKSPCPSHGETGEITLFRKMRVCFKGRMELKQFPFDRQLLQFTITACVPAGV